MSRRTDYTMRRCLGSVGAAVLCLSLALTGCSEESSDRGPGGVSEGEARALDEAAEMLDEQQLPNDAMPEVDLPVAEPAPEGEAPAQPAPVEDAGDTAEQ